MFRKFGVGRPARKFYPFWIPFALLAVLAGACLPAGLQLPESPLLRTLERKSGLIAYLGIDGNIYTIDQGGGNQKALTSDAVGLDGQGEVRHIYQFPAWSPRERRLAYVGIDFRGSVLTGIQLYTVSSDGEERVEVYRSGEIFPFYLYWSPDGKNVSFLASPLAGETLSMQVVPAQGGQAEIIDTGNPFYWAWSPDNRTVLVHTGGELEEGRLAMFEFGDPVHEQELAVSPGPFQSPDWSPDGEQVLLAGKVEGDDSHGLLILDKQGQVLKELAEVEGPIAFDWSPDGKQLAYLSLPFDGEAASLRQLVVLDPDRPEETKKTVEDSVVSFFWSPNGRKLAYFVPQLVMPEGGQAQSGPVLYLALHLMDTQSGETQLVASFQPTPNFANILPNFDQYQRSVTIWSPDSRNLVLSAYDADNEPAIFILEASGNLAPRYLAPGLMAFWSWK